MKKLLSFLFALVFAISFAAPIFAQPGSTSQTNHQQLDHKKKKKKKKKHPGEVSPVGAIAGSARNNQA
jgi:hypothetical protein